MHLNNCKIIELTIKYLPPAPNSQNDRNIKIEQRNICFQHNVSGHLTKILKDFPHVISNA